MITIEIIPPNNIVEHWEEILPHISAAIDYTMGEYDELNVYDELVNGQLLAMRVMDDDELTAVVTLELAEKPLKRVLNIMTCGGENMSAWMDIAMDAIIKLAEEQNIDMISVLGRRGWLKHLQKYNFIQSYTVLTKEI